MKERKTDKGKRENKRWGIWGNTSIASKTN